MPLPGTGCLLPIPEATKVQSKLIDLPNSAIFLKDDKYFIFDEACQCFEITWDYTNGVFVSATSSSPIDMDAMVDHLQFAEEDEPDVVVPR